MATTKASLAEKQTAQNGAAGIGTLRRAKVIYNFALDGGAIGTLIPRKNVMLPKNAVIVQGTVNPTSAPVGSGATVSFGLQGGSNTAILAATAITSLTANALVNTTVTNSAPVKNLTGAKANISMTIATAALTAGIIECTIEYYVANA